MRIESIVLAEGVTQDARGAWTAVAMHQNVFAAAPLPAHTKRAALTRLTDLRDGQHLHFRYTVVGPTGSVLATQESDVELGATPLKDLPATLDYPAEFVLSLAAYGQHRIEFEATDRSANETVVGSVSLYVIDPAKVGLTNTSVDPESHSA